MLVGPDGAGAGDWAEVVVEWRRRKRRVVSDREKRVVLSIFVDLFVDL